MTQIQVVSEEDQPGTPAGCPAGEAAPVTQLITLSEAATGPERHARGHGGERSCCQLAACQPPGLRSAEPPGIAVQAIAARWRTTAMEFLRQSTRVTLLTVRTDLVARALQLAACADELAPVSRIELPLALPAPGSLRELPPGELE